MYADNVRAAEKKLKVCHVLTRCITRIAAEPSLKYTHKVHIPQRLTFGPTAYQSAELEQELVSEKSRLYNRNTYVI